MTSKKTEEERRDQEVSIDPSFQLCSNVLGTTNFKPLGLLLIYQRYHSYVGDRLRVKGLGTSVEQTFIVVGCSTTSLTIGFVVVTAQNKRTSHCVHDVKISSTPL